jgi:hypothetical protein
MERRRLTKPERDKPQSSPGQQAAGPSAEVPDVAQIRLNAERAEIEVGAKPGSHPGHHDRVRAGIPGRMPAGRTPDVPGQDLGGLIVEVTATCRAGSDPEGEVRATVLAVLQLGDSCQQLMDDSLNTRSCFWQCV